MASGQTGSVPTEPLGKALNLAGDEIDLLGALFTDYAAAAGVDGRAVFERLRAGKSLGDALALPKGTVEVLYDRAHRWYKAGRSDKAEPLFRTLCLIAGSEPPYWIGYAVCLRQRGDLAQARMAIETALKLRPDWAVSHFHAVELFAEIGDWGRVASELALFDQHRSDDLPPIMLQEAHRYRVAVEMRGQGARGGSQ